MKTIFLHFSVVGFAFLFIPNSYGQTGKPIYNGDGTIHGYESSGGSTAYPAGGGGNPILDLLNQRIQQQREAVQNMRSGRGKTAAMFEQFELERQLLQLQQSQPPPVSAPQQTPQNIPEANALERSLESLSKALELAGNAQGQPDNFAEMERKAKISQDWQEVKDGIDKMSSKIEQEISSSPVADGEMPPTGTGKKDASPAKPPLSEEQLAQQEYLRKLRGNEYFENELLELLDEADKDANELRSGGVLLPTSRSSDESLIVIPPLLQQRLNSYIKQRSEIDEKAMRDPDAPKSYKPKSVELQNKLNDLINKTVK